MGESVAGDLIGQVLHVFLHLRRERGEKSTSSPRVTLKRCRDLETTLYNMNVPLHCTASGEISVVFQAMVVFQTDFLKSTTS